MAPYSASRWQDRVGRLAMAVMIVAAGLSISGCCDVAREAEEKAHVQRAPDDFLETSDLGYYDEGIINDYRTLRTVTVLNKSRLSLNNLRGEVDWYSATGAKFGSVPFSVSGSIPAGDTKVFSTTSGTLTNGTIRGAAKFARVRFTHVEVVGVR